MPQGFDDGGQAKLMASAMAALSGTFSEESARKLCFEQENQLRVLRQELKYRQERDGKLTMLTAELTGKLADTEIELAERTRQLDVLRAEVAAWMLQAGRSEDEVRLRLKALGGDHE